MLVLSGIAIIVIGFALGVNPLLVVTIAAFASAAAAGHGPVEVVAMIGKAFVSSRFMAVAWLALPTIGLLERAGLRDHARALVGRLRGATVGRVLLGYLAVRQVTAALGLNALGGHVQMVRPIVAPMVEGVAARDGDPALDPDLRDDIRAQAAAVDNIGLFFGEDVFIAIGSILLIRAVLEQEGVVVAPLDVALWAIPTAIMAFIVHGIRLLLLDRRLKARCR
ncbi:DUF969 domain-containing protein [Sphingomonas sp. CFBP8993]|uniref:DUF969 domain-containing protein n=1 Tax=Sphingomonas sp. CFBP8993 TaxID=3096526 RepID=UPI002A6B4195|nr:DUF969 domain-containing protein [Sphingomonas sp. CFBP8993]MDY0960154.1 DUF969 domain-containing protein [Sphingomonas sp. CFBP8993]